MNKKDFILELSKININLTLEQINQLDNYQKILIEYNKHTNLTAIKDEESIYLKHFYDSLTMSKYIKDNQKVLDIGTGAGFPGMVLAITNPHTTFVLLDSNNKKIKFLQFLNEQLRLKNIELINQRAEDYVRNHLEEFDVVTSRAVADLRILAEYSLPALKIGGVFVPMKAFMNEELEKSKETITLLGGQLKSIHNIILPIENSKRMILEIEHIKKTKAIYPRTYDKILKKPLKKI